MQDNKCTKLCKISSHKRQSYQKHSWVFRRSSIVTASEKHPPFKVFDYSVKICFAWYHTTLKNNPPTHSKKEKHTSPCLCSHNKGMNTMICVLQPLFPPLLSSTKPQVYSKVRLPAERVSHGHVILRTWLTRTFVRSPNWHQDSGWRMCCIVGCVHADV